jgi:superfamily II DNA or RNA helicase
MEINLDINQVKNRKNHLSLTSALEPQFDSNEKKKAQFISPNRISYIYDNEEGLGASVRGNQDTYFVTLDFIYPESDSGNKSEPEGFCLLAGCSCPAFGNYNRCKHIWAIARAAGNTVFGRNFSEVMSELIILNRQNSQKSRNTPDKKPELLWNEYIFQAPGYMEYIDEFDSEHEVFQKNLINGNTPRKYFLLINEPVNHLKQHRKIFLIYRCAKKTGQLGTYQNTSISKQRLNRYPDPNFTVIAESIFKIPYQDTNYYQEQEELGYNRYHYVRPDYSSDDIERFLVKPEYFGILRLSAGINRLCFFSNNKGPGPSKREPEELSCLEDTWKIIYSVCENTDKNDDSEHFEIKFSLRNTSNPEILYEENTSDWILNIPSQTIISKNMIIFLQPVPFPELALELINNKNSIKIPRSEIHDFMLSLAKNNELNHFEIPDEIIKSICMEEPKAVLMLDYPANNSQTPMDLCGLPEFHYGTQIITPNDPRKYLPNHENKHEPGLIIARNHNKEAELLKPIAESIPGMTAEYIHRLAAVSIPVTELFPLVEKLLILGWEIRLSNQSIRKSSSNSVSLASGIDWFEISSEVEFDGEIIKIDKLIQAAKDNKNFITFNNGKNIGLIPPELARRLHALSQLGTVKDGKIRLGSNQAIWIDLILKEELSNRHDLDERIETARKNLSSLNGINPDSPSKSFKGTLRDYQQFGLGWLKTISQSGFGACLADDMGLGKTVQILALLDLAYKKNRLKNNQGRHEPSLIVAPKTLIENWLREAAKFTPKLKAIAYHGQSRKEFKDELQSYDIILTTYATLSRDILQLKDQQFNFVVLDEAQAIKNPQSLSAKSCLLLKSRYRLALTGTPIENSLDDLLSIFEFLNPGMLGQMAKKRLSPGTGGSISSESTPYLSKGLLPFILRRTKSEVLKELPPKTEQVLYCELTPRQEKLYEKTKEHYKASLSKEIRENGMLSVKMQFLEALLRLRQICCDPRLINPELKPEDSTKVVTLIEELGELKAAGKKALIFSQFTSFLKLVSKELKAKKFEFDYLDGKTKNRQALVDNFQNHQGSRFFLISIKAGGVGLNLTTADYCFILDPWWNPAVEAQAIDRAHRIGQENPVFAYKLIAKNSVEEKIISLQKSKKELAEIFTGENTGFIKNLTVKDFEMIFD